MGKIIDKTRCILLLKAISLLELSLLMMFLHILAQE
jgi:hypothetical protein